MELKQNADEDVIFAGYRFGDDYLNLQLSAYLYVQATEVGGTHPALVESMGFGNAIVANSTPENMEVLSDAGVFYRFNDSSNLSEILADLIAKPDRVFELRLASRKRATGTYSWDNICSKYEALFASMVRK